DYHCCSYTTSSGFIF
nr:immunoglobulin light chain junction region [Macaca mulatta]